SSLARCNAADNRHWFHLLEIASSTVCRDGVKGAWLRAVERIRGLLDHSAATAQRRSLPA
ncbi:hypothetical protein, partial [Xanthomonas perforans]|uniref:hypothetical protein n=1 Tax=Xanthomonas perforans TaxID=442694 RepID=UPI001F485D81